MSTVRDICHNADAFRHAYPSWPSAEPEEGAMTAKQPTPQATSAPEPCDCGSGSPYCPHCGQFRNQAHRDRCHKAAVGNLNAGPGDSRKADR
jgi:hypothetical protein